MIFIWGWISLSNGFDRKTQELGSTAKARYITNVVTLADNFDSTGLQVSVDVMRPPGADIEVFCRVLARGDKTLKQGIREKSWIKMPLVQPVSKTYAGTDETKFSTEIYKILDDNQHTKFMGNDKVDKKSIVIVLENYGWLQKNALENKFLNYVGDIYKKDVFEKKWRDYLYWDKYEEKQIVGLSKLLNNICDKMNIEKECIGTNVRFNEVVDFKGIVSKSNYDFIYKDINPSFDFKLLTKLLKNE